MATLSPAQIARLASSAGFRNGAGTYGGKGLTWAVAVALAESGGRTDAISPPNSDRWASRDRGLWQINDHWHPADAATALDPAAAAASAFRISNGGRNFAPWATFDNGAAAAQLGRAALGVAGMGSASSGAVNASPALDLIPDLPGLDMPWDGNLPGPEAGDVLGAVPGVVGDVAAGLGAIAKAAAAAVSLQLRLYAWIANPHNAVRIAQVAGGGVLLIVGVRALANSDAGPAADLAAGVVKVAAAPVKVAKQAAGAAVGAVPAGRVAKAAGAAGKAAKIAA